jgi:quercetin dioxygenase-like cupin family protein
MDERTHVVQDLRAGVATPDDGIVSRTIYSDPDVRVVLFSFAAGQQLSDHTASRPLTLQVVDGQATIGVGDERIDARSGTWLHLAAGTMHSVEATTSLTLLLTLLGPAR